VTFRLIVFVSLDGEFCTTFFLHVPLLVFGVSTISRMKELAKLTRKNDLKSHADTVGEFQD